MVKPSLKRSRFELLKPQSWLAGRDLRGAVEQQSARMQPAAEFPIEQFSESAIPIAERDRAVSNPAPPNPASANPASPEPSELPEQPPSSPSGQTRQWQWPLVWFSAFAVLGGMGTAALVWLISLPPQISCQYPERLTLDMERLYCAQEAAQSGDMAKLIAGIELLKQWQPEHPLHGEAQRLITEWSDQVLTLSTQRVTRGDLKGAEAALSHIPATTPVYQEAHKALSRWRKYSKQASGLNAKAQAALKQKDWNAVSDYIVLLAAFERDYWELEAGADALAQRLGVEKQAWQALGRAQKLAADPRQLNAAIQLAQQVPGQTYAAAAAAVSLKQWSQKLVAEGNQKWQKGDRLGAIATLRLDAKIANQPAIEDLYRFGNAYRLANPALSQPWLPTTVSLINLAEAIAAMAQVKPDSPFHAQAQALKQSWQAQLQNLIQIQYANAAARLEHPVLLKLAVAQAQQISPAEPRRLQAQTLIAYWQQEAERLEDQPIVNRAMRLAKGSTIEAYRAAIVEVSQIDLHRALRQQSQTLIATWRSQIQTLEDRPKLEQATDLAQQGKLDQAIQIASQIRSGRALHRQAQAAINDWRYQQTVNIQIAQDQPLLDRAIAQAAAGQLSPAINTAARIGSGRALSGRAQSLIQQWELQLNPPAPPAQPDSNELLAPAINPFNSDSLTDDNEQLEGRQSESQPGNQQFGGQQFGDQQSEGGYRGQPAPSASPEPAASPLSPDPSLGMPSEIETVPPPGTYQPYPQPDGPQDELPAPMPVERYQPPVPDPPGDPLPPDPLPPWP